MVGIVSGHGLGLFNTSRDLLGLEIGQTGLGQANGKAYANIATGNLSVQFLDEALSGSGADLLALRTYNSQGGFVDGDADGWRWSGEKRITLLSGTNNNGTALRLMGDGTYVTFNMVGSVGTSTAGSGAHDTLTWEAATSEWVFKEDSSNDTFERYDGATGWIKSSRDSSGNGFDYTFVGNKLSVVKDLQSGQTLEVIYGGNTYNQLSQINTRITATGAATKQVSYAYDPSGRLSAVTTDLTPTNTTDNNVYTTPYTHESVGGVERHFAIVKFPKLFIV